jgi:hypothetical protein
VPAFVPTPAAACAASCTGPTLPCRASAETALLRSGMRLIGFVADFPRQETFSSRDIAGSLSVLPNRCGHRPSDHLFVAFTAAQCGPRSDAGLAECHATPRHATPRAMRSFLPLPHAFPARPFSPLVHLFDTSAPTATVAAVIDVFTAQPNGLQADAGRTISRDGSLYVTPSGPYRASPLCSRSPHGRPSRDCSSRGDGHPGAVKCNRA